MSNKQFTKLSNYLEIHGLSAVNKPLFYLLITRVYYPNQVDKSLKRTTLTQITTIEEQSNMETDKINTSKKKSEFVNCFSSETISLKPIMSIKTHPPASLSNPSQSSASIQEMSPQTTVLSKRSRSNSTSSSSSSGSSSSSTSSYVKQQKLIKKSNKKIEFGKKRTESVNQASDIEYRPPAIKDTNDIKNEDKNSTKDNKPYLLPTPESLPENDEQSETQSNYRSVNYISLK